MILFCRSDAVHLKFRRHERQNVSIYLYIYLRTCLFTLYIYIYLSIHLLIYLSISVSVFLEMTKSYAITVCERCVSYWRYLV